MSTEQPTAPSTVGVPTGHPIGFWFFFWGEFAERCSYYGMRAILALYMSKALGLSEADAGLAMSLFIAACYFLPIVGGFLADNYFGKYWTIVGFSAPYVVGQFIVGIENPVILVIALCLLAMGSGVIKPNISTLMGLTYDQQRPGQERLRSEAFSLFYLAINVGAAISQTAVPQLRNAFNYQIAFMLPAILMAVALIIFALGKPYYATEVIERKTVTPEESALRWAVLGRISSLFLLVMFFWGIFDQSASTWTFFANTYMDCRLFGYDFPPDAIQAFNAYFIIICLPLMMVLWRVLDSKGIRPRPTDKMIVGFLLTALTMGVMSFAGFLAGPKEPTQREVTKMVTKEDGTKVKEVVTKEVEKVQSDGSKIMVKEPVMEDWVKDENKVTVWWMVLGYLILTIAEILISVTGLELAYVAAPKSMTSFVTACWLLTVFLANILVHAPSTRLYPIMPPGYFFLILTIAMMIVTGLFVMVAGRYNQATTQTSA